ncbi:hypothetical protein OE88DRAFT_1646981 [Heliocybe sulcata]|uniref:Uncharacterized protein n=1 Tax=Heliocybe sulcata TaxID=5364 RepID=A0A5C3N3K9_9AGAM|nr:hypothetical protein OE88DRAFT_1646981 [Heliocybe sulcata]
MQDKFSSLKPYEDVSPSYLSSATRSLHLQVLSYGGQDAYESANLEIRRGRLRARFQRYFAEYWRSKQIKIWRFIEVAVRSSAESFRRISTESRQQDRCLVLVLDQCSVLMVGYRRNGHEIQISSSESRVHTHPDYVQLYQVPDIVLHTEQILDAMRGE